MLMFQWQRFTKFEAICFFLILFFLLTKNKIKKSIASWKQNNWEMGKLKVYRVVVDKLEVLEAVAGEVSDRAEDIKLLELVKLASLFFIR